MYIITNQQTDTTLEARLRELLPLVKEFKILVGYFYFSGLDIIYDVLKNNQNIHLKVLVGLEVGKSDHGIYEYGLQQNMSREEQFNAFVNSLKTVFNSKEFDNQEFEEKARFFLNMMQDGKLDIRKTAEPNHAKLYILELADKTIRTGLFIVGSSNLTKSGLRERVEFNVEISDFGLEKAEAYFDSLWNSAIPITEIPERKAIIAQVINQETPFIQMTPYQAYVVALKHYIDTFYTDKPLEKAKLILEDRGYRVFKYQIDAVNQALNIINEHNGVIIADVVGLGKSITASVLAYVIGEKGIVISPPGLIENWEEYLNDFDLYKLGWKVYSAGKLQNILEIVNNDPNIQVVIVDEAHRFRNEDTKYYDLLSKITRGKKVILLTATPFNNRPSDVFSLIKLFQIPKQSTLTLDGNIANKFKLYEDEFATLVSIKASLNKAPGKAIELYYKTFGDRKIDLKAVERRLKTLSKEIKNFIQPVIIRRNRLDLQNNPLYKKEIADLPKIEDPQEILYGLTHEQSEFYNQVVVEYFGENGSFTGAIYVPHQYRQSSATDINDTDQTVGITQERIRNLIKRFLIKRFESSFASFKKSIESFINKYKIAHHLVTKQKIYVLDKKILDSLALEEDIDDDELSNKLEELIQQTTTGSDISSENLYVYNLKEMKEEEFVRDIENDIRLFKTILDSIERLQLLEKDPKVQQLIQYIHNILQEKSTPKRKIIVFSEFIDTVEYLDKKLQNSGIRVLSAHGHLNKTLIKKIKKNFDASLMEQEWEDNYDVLLATNRLAEGFNLARAGVVVNYDIPWNPVKVIQRVGRINRIGQKVFDSLYIANFFPTEIGESETRQKEIAQNKLLLIHNSIGEDAKIFSPDEEPTASELYRRLTTNPDEIEEESFLTKALRDYQEIKEKDPEIIERIDKLPPHIKVSKKGENDDMVVLVRKNNNLYIVYKDYSEQQPKDVSFEEIYDKIKADKSIPPSEKSSKFWEAYKNIKDYIQIKGYSRSSTREHTEQALAVLHKLQVIIDNKDLKEFVTNLQIAIRDYGVIPTYTLKRISSLHINNPQEYQSELEKIQRELGGKDFLKNYHHKKEEDENIIIAIENQTQQEN